MTAEKEADVFLALARWRREKPPGRRAFDAIATGESRVTAILTENRLDDDNAVTKRITFEDTPAKPLTPERIRALIDDPLADNA